MRRREIVGRGADCATAGRKVESAMRRSFILLGLLGIVWGNKADVRRSRFDRKDFLVLGRDVCDFSVWTTDR